MANRHGRRPRLNSRLGPSSSNGTPPLRLVPDPVSDLPTDAEIAEGWRARRSLEAMGFVFPRPGEAWGDLGGLGPPPDPLEAKVRRELGLE